MVASTYVVASIRSTRPSRSIPSNSSRSSMTNRGSQISFKASASSSPARARARRRCWLIGWRPSSSHSAGPEPHHAQPTFSRRAALGSGSARVERLLARRLAPEATAAAAPAYAGTFPALAPPRAGQTTQLGDLDHQFTITIARIPATDLMSWGPPWEMGVGDLKDRPGSKPRTSRSIRRVVNAQGELKATLGKVVSPGSRRTKAAAHMWSFGVCLCRNEAAPERSPVRRSAPPILRPDAEPGQLIASRNCISSSSAGRRIPEPRAALQGEIDLCA